MSNPVEYCWHCLEPHGGRTRCVVCGATPHTGLSDLAHVLAPGDVLAERFLLGGMLGQGGFGIVYLGRDLRLDARVAIKEYFPRTVAARSRDGRTVNPTGGDDPDAYGRGLHRFVREARMATKFRSHPNVVTVLDYVEAHGTAYLVMEYLEGQTALGLAGQKGVRLDEATAVGIAIAALDGLHALHEQGLVHHDVKPANVYVTRQGPVKLMDFGAVRHALGAGSGQSTVYLTEGYAPPESYAPVEAAIGSLWSETAGWTSPPHGALSAIGPWTDVYSVGAMLWELLTGEPPPGAVQRQARQMGATGVHESPRLVMGETVSIPVSAAVMKAMSLPIADRFQEARSFQDALLVSADKPPPDPPENPRSRSKRMAILAGAIGLAGFIGWQVNIPSAGRTTNAEAETVVVSRRPDAATARLGAEPRNKDLAPLPDASFRSDSSFDLVPVSAGEFVMGCNAKVDAECDPAKEPARRPMVPAFEIDVTEVTVEAYRRCVEAEDGCSADGVAIPFWSGEPRPWRAKWCNWDKRGRTRHPMNCVNWYQASAYCRWRKKRLPTEAEWEKAARGTDGRKYPWGNKGYDELKPTKLVANIADRHAKSKHRGWTTTARYDDGVVGTAPVQKFKSGRSQYGADDMMGNVWEWVDEWYLEGEYASIRGGSWFFGPAYARASTRMRLDPKVRRGDVGFRCAR